MRVLLVDDEALIRMDLKDLLESQGCTIVGEGKNGIEAIELAKKLKPQVILMDIKMPELDGIEAARQINYHRIAPVVLLTAYSQEDLVEKAMDSGVYGYLIKPVKANQVLPALKMALGRFREKENLQAEKRNLTKSLEERKIITRATGIIMETHKLSEQVAYERIRKYSMEKGKPLVEICKAIIKSQSVKRLDK